MKIYVASSWANVDQNIVVKALQSEGFDVYDFREPTFEGKDFKWSQILEKFDHDKQLSPFTDFMVALNDPIVEKTFDADWEAMERSDACVMVLPCGNSAHLEFGYFVGAHKPCIIYISNQFKVELMYKTATLITNKIESVVKCLHEYQEDIRNENLSLLEYQLQEYRNIASDQKKLIADIVDSVSTLNKDEIESLAFRAAEFASQVKECENECKLMHKKRKMLKIVNVCVIINILLLVWTMVDSWHSPPNGFSSWAYTSFIFSYSLIATLIIVRMLIGKLTIQKLYILSIVITAINIAIRVLTLIL